jgi:transcription initiation factor TFIIIB Brf1 subunit/transcription initiation factor TFIIB
MSALNSDHGSGGDASGVCAGDDRVDRDEVEQRVKRVVDGAAAVPDRVAGLFVAYFDEIAVLPGSCVVGAGEIFTARADVRGGHVGRDYERVVAACVLLSVQKENAPVTVTEVLGVHGLESSGVLREKNELRSVVDEYHLPAPPEVFVERLLCVFGGDVSECVEECVFDVLGEIRVETNGNVSPPAAAVAAVWAAGERCREPGVDPPVTQSELSDEVGVCMLTVRRLAYLALQGSPEDTGRC